MRRGKLSSLVCTVSLWRDLELKEPRLQSEAEVRFPEQVLQKPNWPDTPPFSPDDFQRFDESSDAVFYSQASMVSWLSTHV